MKHTRIILHMSYRDASYPQQFLLPKNSHKGAYIFYRNPKKLETEPWMDIPINNNMLFTLGFVDYQILFT